VVGRLSGKEGGEMNYLLIIGGCALIGYACYIVGYAAGERSRKFSVYKLALPMQEAFVLFQKAERNRHVEDICKIDKYLADMRKRGIFAPEVPMGLWIETK
jgi:hypothetical protein